MSHRRAAHRKFPSSARQHSADCGAHDVTHAASCGSSGYVAGLMRPPQRCCERCRLWGSLLLCLVAGPRAVAQSSCDATCQTAQQRTLAALYTATGGPTWKATSVMVADPAGWLSDDTSVGGLPAHCEWSGARRSFASACRQRSLTQG